MKANIRTINERFTRRRPSLLKNPRCVKKAWKTVLCETRRVETMGPNGGRRRYRVRWVPMQGWTVTWVMNAVTYGRRPYVQGGRHDC